MRLEHKSFGVIGVKTSDAKGTIECIVSVFQIQDSGDEVVLPGFFKESIQKKLPKGVWMHDWSKPVAKTLIAQELMPGDPKLPASIRQYGGLYIKGQFNLDTQRGKEAYSDIKFGIVDEFSIGYRVLEESTDKETGARQLIKGDLKEWSPVLVGMNDQTALIGVKGRRRTSSTGRLLVESLKIQSEAVGAIVKGSPNAGRMLRTRSLEIMNQFDKSLSSLRNRHATQKSMSELRAESNALLRRR